MFMDLIDFPIESERLSWQARQVVRDIEAEPTLLMRIKLTGTHFPQRALEPFVQVGAVRSHLAEIADDGLSVSAYFDQPLPPRGVIEYGYGDDVMLRFHRPFGDQAFERLDPKRLPRNTRFIDRFFGSGPVG